MVTYEICSARETKQEKEIEDMKELTKNLNYLANWFSSYKKQNKLFLYFMKLIKWGFVVTAILGIVTLIKYFWGILI